MAGGVGCDRPFSPFTTVALSARPPLLWHLPRPVVGGQLDRGLTHLPRTKVRRRHKDSETGIFLLILTLD